MTLPLLAIPVARSSPRTTSLRRNALRPADGGQHIRTRMRVTRRAYHLRWSAPITTPPLMPAPPSTTLQARAQ